jgi:hypothetical protein
LLKLKTLALRIVLPLVVFLVWAPGANAWSWPVRGPVLQPFSFDEAHPYAPGQHRGVDIGADAAGESVIAPAAGTVSFAGTVPTSGKSVTIQTADGYSVTLTHLGSILVAKGVTVAEQDAVGTVGPSGTPELAGPYVHLGIRLTADPNGYLDPLDLLPPAADGGASGSDSTTPQPSSSGAASSPPVSQPAGSGSSSSTPAGEPPAPAVPARPRVVKARGSTDARGRTGESVHHDERPQESRTNARPPQTSQSPEPHHAAPAPLRRPSRPASSSRRPVVETATPVEPTGLGAGHEISSSEPAAQPVARPQPVDMPLALLCNGAAALIALAAALAAARTRRRRCVGASSIPAAEVVHLPRQRAERRPTSRAA